MGTFRDMSIRRKLMMINMTTSCVALLLAAAAFTWYEFQAFRGSASYNLLSLADIIGSNSTAAIPFNDQRSAEETLSALRAEGHAVSACIYTADGKVFATYYRDPGKGLDVPPFPSPDGFGFEESHITIFRSVMLDGEKIGTVYIQYDLTELYGRLQQYLLIVGVVMLASMLAAFLLSSALQKVISTPVRALAQIARSVSVDRNYSVRATAHSKDELGQMINGFNDMLTQIQLRDSALQQAHDELERRVEERTQSLESSVSLLHATLESTADGILVVDQHNNVINFNGKFVDMWRIPEELLTSRLDDRMLQFVLTQLADPEEFRRRVQEVYSNPDIESFDVVDFRDGRVFERYSHPQRVGGVSVGRVWSFRDVTAQHRANDLIREQATLLEKARDAILVDDADGVIKFWNKGAERLYGWTAAEAIGRKSGELLHGGDQSATAPANKALHERSEWAGELEQLTKDNREILVESRWSLVQVNGNPKTTLHINTDITEKKRLEAQFLRVQRMEGIGTLAAGIAHDINNILSPIMMSVDLLKEKCRDPHTSRLLGILGTNAQRGADLVKQVLTFARGVEGERVTVQLKHLIKEIERIARETFPRAISIETAVARDLWPISGDATQLHQVLLNFCVNARDAISGDGTIVISAENVMLDERAVLENIEAKIGSYVILAVSDTGAGIPKDIVNKIFDPFFTTKERGKGTGLGLSTVIAIVKSHGGFVTVETEIGKGTSFRAYLPALAITEADVVEQQSVAPARGNGELILVVDDEVAILEMTKAMLVNAGYDVVMAENGRQALTIYAQRRDSIALVITDIMMPVMDGPTMINELRKMNSDVKVIGASGLAGNAASENGAQSEVCMFLPKPFTSEKLLQVLHVALSEACKGCTRMPDDPRYRLCRSRAMREAE
ncbi:MAG: PAS domain S-box protein [Ignavibacteriae bacterium]|nr:PAS domain S-box protein [Ignavibacteriota bacterium]